MKIIPGIPHLPDIPWPVKEHINILNRICVRGEEYFFRKRDSSGVALFTHMKNELEQLSLALGIKKDG